MCVCYLSEAEVHTFSFYIGIQLLEVVVQEQDYWDFQGK